MKFRILAEYHYMRAENQQPQIPSDITSLEQRNTRFFQTNSARELCPDVRVIQPQITIFNQIPNRQNQDNFQPLPQPIVYIKNIPPPTNYKRSYTQSDTLSQSRHTLLRVPALFLLYLALFIIIFIMGIIIFTNQSDEIAILVIEVFIMIINLISGCFYYSKSTVQLFQRPKYSRIFYCILLTELLFSFIQVLICLIKNVAFSFSLINFLFLSIFLGAFYFQKKKFKKWNFQR